MKPTFPGLKELLLLRRPNRGSPDITAIGAARALFQAPESAMSKQHESLVEFLGGSSLRGPRSPGTRARRPYRA